MKNRNSKFAVLVVLALSLMSFSSLITKTIKIEDSSITWKGYKVGGEHTGTIDLKSGTLIFDGTALTGGNFVIDMTSINTTDLKGDYKGKLDGHLKSDDFFGVDEFPTATLDIISATGKAGVFNVNANLTIKGITAPISFVMTISDNTATANLKIDRTKHNITYKSPSILETLKDKAIYDDFDLNVTLKF